MRHHCATVLSLVTLEDRLAPATFSLTTAGSTAQVNGATFAQYTDTLSGNETPSFVRIGATGTERGYNTDARPVQFDTLTNKQNTQAITVAEVPKRNIDGVDYREFFLNINQTTQQPRLSVDEVQIFLGETGTLRGYSNGKLAGLDPVFNLDAGENNTILLDARLNTGGKQTDDMRLLVPETVFVNAGASGETFVYLYSRMGATAGAKANGDFEEWGMRTDGGGAPNVPPPPPPPGGTGSLAGRVYIDLDMEPGQSLNDVGVEGTTITLTWVDDQSVTQTLTTQTDVDGFYSFTDLVPDTYTITQTQPGDHQSDGTEVGSLGGTIGVDGDNDLVFGINVDSGDAGTGYNFEEIFVGG